MKDTSFGERIRTHLKLTDFEKKVLLCTLEIKKGETITYAELARKVGSPKAARAVGRALSKNPYPVKVPCHRVVSVSGPGGYKLGKSKKEELLREEKEGLL